MNILVTGGTGFIGSHVVEELVNAGHKVKVTGQSSNPENLSAVTDRIEYIQGNIFSGVDLDELLSDIDVVYHLLWTSLPRQSFNFLLNDLHFNVSFGVNLLQACVKAGVKKIIFTSSGGTVYGITGDNKIKEDHPLEPVTSYGLTKVAFEKYLRLFKREYGLDYQIYRVSNAYGSRQDPDRRQGVITTWLNNILHGKTIEIWGNGEVVRDYIYVSDIASAMVRSASLDGSYIFNIGSGEGYSLNQILDEIQSYIGRKPDVKYLPQHRNDVPVNVLDCTCLTETLGWKPEISFRQGIALTHEYLLRKTETFQGNI